MSSTPVSEPLVAPYLAHARGFGAGELLVLPDLSGVRALDDDALMSVQRELAEARRRVDAASATVVGELARRSHRDLGYRGLAQRTGARTVERLVSNLTGMSGAESRAMVVVGEALGGDAPWLNSVVESLASGGLSVGAAAAIKTGLGDPSAEVSREALDQAAQRLADEAKNLTPEKTAQRAREARDELDAAGVADREAALRERRYLRLIPQGDGMTRVTGLLDPESAALVTDAFDRVTAPRRGGVRFVDPAEQNRAEAIQADERSTEQLMVDAFVQMVRVAGDTDRGAIFGRTAPSVRVHVTLDSLQRGVGSAFAEGQGPALSIGTVHRMVCAGGVIPILFDDDGRSLNVGRTERLFTARQRIAIAARDGGCLIDGCDRPPSWTEAHHIDHWDEHHGETNVDDGVALCRHHHMWVHDSGARIVRVRAEYVLHRPGEPPVALKSKSRIAHGARAA
jgi:hypothetical protein